MPEPLVIQTHHNPSLFNKDMLLGGLIGLVASAFIPGGGALGAVFTGGSAVVGGLIGRARQNHENMHGKPVSEPSVFNKDMLIGGLIGLTLAGFVAAIAGTMALGGIFTAAAVAPAATPLVAGVGLAATLAAGALSPVIGGYIGGRMGKSQQEAELDVARHQKIGRYISETVSPEVGQAVEYSLGHNKEWAKNVLEDRLMQQAQDQQPVR